MTRIVEGAIRHPLSQGAKRFLDVFGLGQSAFDFVKLVFGILGLLAPASFTLQWPKSQAFVISQMSLPIRLMVVLAAAAILGAGLGLLTAWLTRKDSDVTTFISTLFAGGWALMLVIAVNGMSDSSGSVGWPEFALFFVLALALSVSVLTVQLSARFASITGDRVSDRATVILIFVSVATVTALIVRLAP